MHIPLLEKLCGVGSILQSEKDQAADEFDNIPDEAIEDAFDTLMLEFEDTEWIELVGGLYARWNTAHA